MRRFALRVLPYAPSLLGAVYYAYFHRQQPLSQLSSPLMLVLVSGVFPGLTLHYCIVFSDWTARFKKEFLGQVTKQPTIHTSPGIHLHSFARTVFPKKSFELVIEPTLRDMFDEYCEALAEGRPKKARWVRIRGYWSFWSVVLMQLPISATKLVVTVWKAIK